MKDDKLWKVFSIYIRSKDADENGYVKCFTCPTVKHWRDMDCGHGIGRQHKSTKFDERNNHPQCKKCNGFEAGEQALYKEEVEKKYGKGTWDKLILSSRQVCKRGKFEIDAMTAYYKNKIL